MHLAVAMPMKLVSACTKEMEASWPTLVSDELAWRNYWPNIKRCNCKHSALEKFMAGLFYYVLSMKEGKLFGLSNVKLWQDAAVRREGKEEEGGHGFVGVCSSSILSRI